ncbi:NAC domain-containing protein [Dioscorea alata]|uniref:NAC domain-containing protein n=1 Tax=Dioscorea alata TaxID=55571 RepID=A0ACB7VET2_DIOAL|nr:NAC domain-containing protein [Dioscorea alata]
MTSPSLPPGFRFFPTDEELIVHYLSKRASSLPLPVSIIAEVDIYKFDPWDLPAKAVFGDKEWYFFTPRDRKYPNGVRPNRAAISGYWKATGTDKQIHSNTNKKNIGVKKALVFYRGKPPKGQKTCWIMHEYRLTDSQTQQHKLKYVKPKESSMRLDDWVLCRIYKKNTVNHSTPPVAPQLGLGLDKDQEETSTVEDFYSSGLVNVDKSFSLSDLLNDAEYSNLSQLLTMEHDIPGPKRIKPAHGFLQDGAGFLPSSSKKINSSCMTNLFHFN